MSNEYEITQEFFGNNAIEFHKNFMDNLKKSIDIKPDNNKKPGSIMDNILQGMKK